jgi:hypothetical protein
MTRPGERIRVLALRLFEQTTMERLIEPAIADLQHEHDVAIRDGAAWRRRWIRVTGYVAVWKVFVIAATEHGLSEGSAADRRAVGRTIVFSLAAMIAPTALFVGLPLNVFRFSGHRGTSWLVLYLLPQALAVSVPIGIPFGILLALRKRELSTRVQWTVAALGVICCAATLINVAWLMPAGNQAFRLQTFRQLNLIPEGQISRGPNELTLGELASKDASKLVWGMTSRQVTYHLHFRFALAFAPLALDLFSLGVTRASRRRRGAVVMGLAALTTAFGYYVFLYYSRRTVLYGNWMSPVFAAWAPDLAFLGIALLLVLRRRQPGTAESRVTGSQRSG